MSFDVTMFQKKKKEKKKKKKGKKFIAIYRGGYGIMGCCVVLFFVCNCAL
jgi:hypothetical protein